MRTSGPLARNLLIFLDIKRQEDEANQLARWNSM